MAQPPPHIAQCIQHRYPRPIVDPEWLQGCYQWLISQPGANDSSQKFLADVEEQFLRSDLVDSTLEGTGLPVQTTQSDFPEANARLAGSPVLVEITAITEIGQSAYQLDQVRVAREERMRLGQTDDDGEGEGDLEVEGEGPMPKYPRSMLKFQLSDGTNTLSAIEYRYLPAIILGRTPLGFKLLLKNPIIRHGIAFLEPSTVELLGFQSEEKEALQRSDFARGLHARLGLPIDPQGQPENNLQQINPQVAAAQAVRSPLREISPPPEPPLNPPYNDDANLEPRRRKLPSTNTTLVPGTQSSTAPSATLVASPNTTSQYFPNIGSAPASSNTGLNSLNLGLTTAQASQVPAVEDDDEEEALFNHFDSAVFLDAPVNSGPDENAPPPSSAKPPASTAPVKPFSPTVSSTTFPSTSTTAVTKTPTASGSTHSLAAEDSIEIVSFTLSQPLLKSQPSTKGKGKEKTPTNNQGNLQSSSAVAGVLDLDPLFLKDPDEENALGYAVPELKRRQDEEPVHVSNPGGGPVTRVAAMSATRGAVGKRPIKPLPRKSLGSSQGSSQPSSQPSRQEVIEIDTSSSSSSPELIDKKGKALPKTRSEARRGGKDRGDEDNDIEVLDVDDLNDEDYQDAEEEELYDKENMPVMTRHVRRKVANSEGATLSRGLFGKGKVGDDVIVLSDED